MTQKWNEAYDALKRYGDLNNIINSLNNIDSSKNNPPHSNTPPSNQPNNPSGGGNGGDLRVGDRVKSVKAGNSQSDGKGRSASSKLTNLRVDKVFDGRAFPYRVTRNGTYMGFYKWDGLQKYHTGGNIGKPTNYAKNFMELMNLKSGEVPIVAQIGESVVTNSHMKNFMTRTMPALLVQGISPPKNGMNVINIEMGDINIEGNTDEALLQKIKAAQKKSTDNLLEKLQQSQIHSGFKRNAKSMY